MGQQHLQHHADALLISILLATHRTEKRRAFWLGFALFGWIYLGLSLVPSIQSRLITTKALSFVDSKVQRSIPAGLVYFDYDNDGKTDLYVANNSQANAVYRNKGNGTFEHVAWEAGTNPAVEKVTGDGWISDVFVGPTLARLSGSTVYFVRIGHSLIALIAAILGGLLSRQLHARTLERRSEPPEHAEHLSGRRSML